MSNLEIVKQQDIETIENLSSISRFSKVEIETFIVRRLMGNSKNKIFDRYWSKNSALHLEEDKVEVQMRLFSLLEEEEFKELVSMRMAKMNLVETSLEEMQLIEKLVSVMNGEAQGMKMVKKTIKEFQDGRMTQTEEFEEVPNYPSVGEQIRATSELHKLGFLNAKDKSKIELENDKMKQGNGDVLDMLTSIMKDEERAKEMEAVVVEEVNEADILEEARTIDSTGVEIDVDEVLAG